MTTLMYFEDLISFVLVGNYRNTHLKRFQILLRTLNGDRNYNILKGETDNKVYL